MPSIDRCRICASADLHFFLNLGNTPLANSFVRVENAGSPEPHYPLHVGLCRSCGLVQLGHVVDRELLFKDYIYFSSTSETIRKHFAALAEEVLEEHAREGDLIVEVASNDGVLLKHLLGRGVRALGVESATNIAQVANQAGVETINDFFDSRTAAKIAASRGPAACILANNVLAHIADLHDCAAGMRTLLADTGTVIVEVPYLCEFFENLEFDTVYHEHLSYFSLKPIIQLFGQFDMEVIDAKELPVHGGSIRIYLQKKGSARRINTPRVAALLEKERMLGLYEPDSWNDFAKKVETLRVDLVALLQNLKDAGKRVAIYGTPAKGNTLLNYCRIGTELAEYAVDGSRYKQNLLTPGMHIPVHAPQKIAGDKPDYLLVLAWTLIDEIMNQQDAFRKGGGRFIQPVPTPRIL
jgi:hypothetical protein